MRLDAAGNLGLGAPPSVWRNGSYALQFGTLGALNIQQNGTLSLTFGAYEGSNNAFNYTTTGDAPVKFSMVSGAAVWQNAVAGTAGSPVSFTERMRIDANGNVGIGKVPVPAFGILQVAGMIEQRNAGPAYRAGLILEGGSAGSGDYSPALTFSCNTNNAAIYSTRLSGYGGNLVFATQDSAGSILERQRITTAGVVQTKWQYGGTFIPAGSIINLNTVLPAATTTGVINVALIHVGGSENGAANVSYGVWMVLKISDVSFVVQKVSEIVFGNGHGQPVLTTSGANLVITNQAGSAIGGWQLSFSTFTP
jgi:hypothetical protein